MFSRVNCTNDFEGFCLSSFRCCMSVAACVDLCVFCMFMCSACRDSETCRLECQRVNLCPCIAWQASGSIRERWQQCVHMNACVLGNCYSVYSRLLLFCMQQCGGIPTGEEYVSDSYMLFVFSPSQFPA